MRQPQSSVNLMFVKVSLTILELVTWNVQIPFRAPIVGIVLLWTLVASSRSASEQMQYEIPSVEWILLQTEIEINFQPNEMSAPTFSVTGRAIVPSMQTIWIYLASGACWEMFQETFTYCNDVSRSIAVINEKFVGICTMSISCSIRPSDEHCLFV